MNKTTLSHLTVLARIFAAMRKAVKTGLPQCVLNRKGEPYCRVDYRRGEVNAFTFWDSKQRNKTAMVLAALRGK